MFCLIKIHNFAKFCIKICAFSSFSAFCKKQCWKSIFRPAFGVCRTQTLVKIFNIWYQACPEQGEGERGSNPERKRGGKGLSLRWQTSKFCLWLLTDFGLATGHVTVLLFTKLKSLNWNETDIVVYLCIKKRTHSIFALPGWHHEMQFEKSGG